MPSQFETSLEPALARLLVGTPSNLAEAIRYSLLAPGKRIRPRLALASAEMLGLARPAALPAALAIEMVHCFTLIHDDLPCMDDDDLRRGRPSNHKVHGEALALLAGDALTPLAIDALLESPVAAELRLAAVRRLSSASGPRGVIGGQAAESLLTSRSELAEMTHMHALKTGALFEAAVLLPLDLAGISPGEPTRALERFAATLGLAFQIADDLDDALEGEASAPTSILHFKSAEDARQETHALLARAIGELQRTWGERSHGLTAIAQEVLQALRPAPLEAALK